MKRDVKEVIIQITEAYIKSSRKRIRHGVTSRELKEHIDSLKYINLQDITSYNIGKILAESKKFISELKWSSKYSQDLNHWRLK